MSHRRTPPSSSGSRPGSPYSTHTRPPPGKSKKREQFSACGACRMRRVRCDLKDMPLTPNGLHPPCSNCKERGLNCVDEFAESKAVKLLRRGRRLQQVEAVYGKSNPEETLHHVLSPQCVIPKLHREFFDSPFFRKFHIQKPILEPLEFRERYLAYLDGNLNAESFGIAAQLIAHVLVVWAATFDIDESGQELQEADLPRDPHQRAELISDMLQEMLSLVDIHGITRKPSWDGVRLLLLLLPLTQEIQSPIERLVMYEATLSHVHALCTLLPLVSSHGAQDECLEALVRARIVWYGHVLDGVTNGLRGGRLILDVEDLGAFEALLPTQSSSGSNSYAIYASTRRLLSIPLRISSACRQIHACLTSVKARRVEVNGQDINSIWNCLGGCWKDLAELRHWTIDSTEAEEVRRFMHSWQIYIFECYNVIRENLKQRITPRVSQAIEAGIDRRSIESVRLYDDAKARCDSIVRDVLNIIRANLTTDLFRYDACLVRDGCFFAAFVLADGSGSQEDVDVCLTALSQMRWIFSKSEERINTLRMLWETRIRNDSPHPSEASLNGLIPSNYSDIRRQSRSSFSVPPLALVPPHDSAVQSHSAPTTAYSDDGRWPHIPSTSDARVLPLHVPLQTHLGSPLAVPQHSPRYSQVTQPLPQLGGQGMGNALTGSPPTLLPGPSSLAFARPDAAQQPYYMQASTYAEYSGYEDQAASSSVSDHAHSSSDSNHTPTPPGLRYQQPSPQYFQDPVAYSHAPVTDGSSGDALHQSPAPDDVGGGGYY